LKVGKKITVLFLLLAASVFSVPAQTNNAIITTPKTPPVKTTPQWAKDIRRWEIVAFGSIPFTMLVATTAVDISRWNKANGMDFSSEGRRYAPWPLKSSGAVAMKRKEIETTLLIAGSLSIGVAVADQIIVQVKRYKARKRAEALPVGTAIIIRKPLFEEPSEEAESAGNAAGTDNANTP